jgi:hypothetical protein
LGAGSRRFESGHPDFLLSSEDMSTAAKELLTAFDALPDPDRTAVMQELLLRPVGMGEWADDGLESAAEELFLSYDDEEAVDAAPAR